MFQLRDLTAGVRRRVAAVATGAAILTTALVSPGMAAAQELPNPEQAINELSSDLGLDDARSAFDETIGGIDEQARDEAWAARNRINSQTSAVMNTAQAATIMSAVDQAIETVFPGLIAERTAPEPTPEPEPAPAPPPAAAPSAPRGVDTGSCPASADVCVDLDGNRTWLQDNGGISYGPVSHSPGRPDAPTPRGTFQVNRKVKDEVSWEFNNAPMPFAIYFTNNGHAFHAGTLDSRSAGCVRLNYNDAAYYFDNVHIGDTVYIY